LAEKLMQSPPGPQHTSRIRKVFAANPELNWGHFELPIPARHTPVLADIMESLPLGRAPWWDETRKTHLWQQMFERHQVVLSQMQAQAKISFATVFRRMRDNISRAELRYDGIAGCLRTPRGGSSKQILIQAGHGRWDVRLLTPREYARLQGVRDSYRLPENENQGYFAMADAVCVPVIEFLARQILVPVYKY
jgi:DNA (cytosine-5)-methyltransferase 1